MLITGRVINQLSHENLADIKMRLAPEYPYPTGINDGYDALKWVSHDSCAAYIPIANLLVV